MAMERRTSHSNQTTELNDNGSSNQRRYENNA